jgi:hypothetical protein
MCEDMDSILSTKKRKKRGEKKGRKEGGKEKREGGRCEHVGFWT